MQISKPARLLMIAGLFAMSNILNGCATPTKGSITEPRAFAPAMNAPIVINEATVVVDARPAFEYSTNHIPKSVPLQWSDFTEAEPAQRGILQADLYGATRRLARAGLSPESQVVVVGRGLQGGGEEGRIAWMLAFLGIPRVQFTTIEAIKPRLVTEPDASGLPSATMWKPTPNEAMTATRDEVLFAINKQAVAHPESYKGAPARLYRMIDVRSERAYLGKEGLGAVKHIPNMEAMNVPWTQFFTKDMRPNEKTISTLRQMGFVPSDRILVLDENGIASAAVTMALRASGFPQAANYAGGLQDLIP